MGVRSSIDRATKVSLGSGVCMELRTYCAYNETRECFLGLEIAAGDFSYKSLSREGALTVKSSQGLWLTPFRGIPDSGVTAPIDLVFFDKECRVIDLVESFPAISGICPLPDADSLLVLPPQSILLSETRVGDQVVLCVTEEMQRHLEQRYAKSVESGTHAPAALSATSSVRRRVLQFVGLEKRSEENETVAPRQARVVAKGNWIHKLWPSDLRSSPRRAVNGLRAFYWNGLPPDPHEVRDISSTGLYVVTDDRWYPGTVILMTLQDSDALEPDSGHAVAVNVRAVRCGDDGVGLQFMLTDDDKEAQRGKKGQPDDKREFDKFLRRFM